MSFIYDIIDAIDNMVSGPAAQVKIEIPEVMDAYFATRKPMFVKSDASGGSHAYTFKYNNNVAADNRSNIANIILKKVNEAERANNKFTKLDNVTSVLKNQYYKAGSIINIPLFKYKEQVSFEKINSAILEEKVYLIVETLYFRGEEIWIEIRQGKEKVIVEEKKRIEILHDNYTELIKVNVGEWATDKDIENKDDFKDWAIAEITLRPNSDEELKKWETAIGNTINNRTHLCLLVDAKSPNPDYANIIYYGNKNDEANSEHSNITNYWLDVEGKWFELGKRKMLFPFKSIPLNHPDKFKNDSYKRYDYNKKEDNAASFGYRRGSNRIHAACDLYYEIGEPIYAIEDGIVKAVYPFYYDTWAIEIEHDYEYKKGYKLYVRYGEVSKNNIKVKAGQKVLKGEKIAEIGLLYNKAENKYIVQPSPDKRGMLHIEMYTGEATGKLSNKTVKYTSMLYAKSSKYSTNRSFQRRRDLIDPLPLLKEMYNTSKAKNIIQ